MRQYLDLLRHVLENGVEKEDRTGTGTLSVVGGCTTYNLSEGFPAITTKKIHFKSIIHELLWFVSGNTNVNYLQENGVRIWNEWADEKGELGPVYGAQWRNWNDTGIDQLKNTIQGLKENPNSRRHLITAWNPEKLSKMALPPCHAFFQFMVHGKELSCHLYQRSADLFLGVPFNLSSYSLLTHMIAQVCDLEVGKFVHSYGDLHLYKNHIEQAKLQLTREPFPLPKLWLDPSIKDIDDFCYEHIKIKDYQCHPKIKAPIAV